MGLNFINLGERMKTLLLITLLSICLGSVQASTIRFTDLDSEDIARVLEGKSNQIVEFRRGDLIPLNLKVEGDLLSIDRSTPNVLKVKKDFFIQVTNSSLKISFDGEEYLSLSDALSGLLNVVASGNSIPSMINVMLHVEKK